MRKAITAFLKLKVLKTIGVFLVIVFIFTSCTQLVTNSNLGVNKESLPQTTMESKSDTNEKADGSNPFFYKDISARKEYLFEGTVWGDNIIDGDKPEKTDNEGMVYVDAKLTVSEIAQLSKGIIYELDFELISVESGTVEKGATEFLWVTEDKIYQFTPPDGFDCKDYVVNGQFDYSLYAKFLQENGQLPSSDKAHLICSNSNFKFTDSWQTEMTVNKNICTYSKYNPGNSDYLKFVWEIGRGLTGYSWGQGALKAGMDLHLADTTKIHKVQNDLMKDDGSNTDARWFVGAINDSLKIHLKLDIQGNRISGIYYYDKYKKNIELSGEYCPYDKSFGIREKGSDCYINAIYISDGLIEGTWSEHEKSYPMYAIKEGTNIPKPKKPDNELMKWIGDWNGIHQTHWSNTQLTVKPIYDNLIVFELDAEDGTHSGNTGGLAVITDGTALFIGDPAFNGGNQLEYTFRMDGKENIHLDADNADSFGYMCGTGVYYDREYTKKPIVLKDFNLKDIGIVDTEEQNKIFQELTGDNYGAFLQYAEFGYEAEDLDGFGATVTVLGVRGYMDGAIIMVRPTDNTFWAAVEADNSIHYYTNDKSSSDIPKTIANWRDPNESVPWEKTMK